MSKTAICPGSFDPPTDGHINIVERSLKIFDRVIVAVADNISKNPIFTTTERVNMLNDIFRDYENVEVEKFEGLLAEYAKTKGINTFVRGIRNSSDYEYEFQMALANKTLNPKLEILFMMTEGKYSHLSSTIIKEILTCGGEGKGMMHPIVEAKLKEKLRGNKMPS